jgi:hypothetical protein
MKAIEATATINENGELTLDQSLGVSKPQRVRLIVLLSEGEETDPDETPIEIVIEGIRQGLHQALTGQTIPLSEMWEGIDAEWKIINLIPNSLTIYHT